MKFASGRKRRSHRPKIHPEPEDIRRTRSAVPILIAYSDIPSARHAMATLTQLLQRSGCALQPMLWRFDQLGEPRWREMSLRDACRARTVAFAVADELYLERAPEMWLRAVLERMRGSSLNVLALIGVAEIWTLNFEQVARTPTHPSRAASSPTSLQHTRLSAAPAALNAAG